jgi:anti-sigma28 factor (negative regulator of flagellin synthesis)
MKFKTRTRTKLVEFTLDGRTHQVEETYEEKIPVLPRDWDALATKVGVGLVGMLTLISVVWSTVGIGGLLGGGVGFLAALLFDISWAVCLILEWKARFNSKKRAFPRNLGWILLGVTMFFIGWHGFVKENIPLAVVGACVSLFAKVLWLGIMKHVDRELDPDHQQWVNKVISEANARLAVAQVLRQVALAEDQAVALKLAIEANRPEQFRAEQVPNSFANTPSNSSNEFANSSNTETLAGSNTTNSSVLTGPNTGSNSSNTPPNTEVSMSERVRELFANGSNKDEVVAKVLEERPGVNRGSLEVVARRVAKKLAEEG